MKIPRRTADRIKGSRPGTFLPQMRGEGVQRILIGTQPRSIHSQPQSTLVFHVDQVPGAGEIHGELLPRQHLKKDGPLPAVRQKAQQPCSLTLKEI